MTGSSSSTPLDENTDKDSSSSTITSPGGILDLKDPFQVLALAVRLDERRCDEAVLQVPLEFGRLYGSSSSSSSSSSFAQALEYLERATAPPRSSGSTASGNSDRHRRTSSSSLSLMNCKHNALTPVILSGLLAAMKQQRHEQGSSSSSTTNADDNSSYDTLSSELVLSCQTMRRAALHRVIRRKQRRRAQKVLLPILCMAVLLALYLRSVSEMRRLLLQFQYVGSCDRMEGSYQPVCLLTEAELWEYYRDYIATLQPSSPELVVDQQLQQQQQQQQLEDEKHHMRLYRRWSEPTALYYLSCVQAPFAIQTVLFRETITLQDIVTGKRAPTRATGWPSLGPGTSAAFRQQVPIMPAAATAASVPVIGGHELTWLGASTVNLLVRDAIETYLPPKMDLKVLDVGCGVGGTLYTILPPATAINVSTDNKKAKIQPRKFRYRGIAISAAEVYHAQQLVKHHGLVVDDNDDATISFRQQSYDDRTLEKNAYTVIVAIESLSWSRDLKETLANLMQSLEYGGIFVIVDDVVLPSEAGRIAMDPYTFFKPSVLTAATWKDLLNDAGCKVKVVRDLSIEWDVPTMIVRDERQRNDPKNWNAGSNGMFALWQYRLPGENWFFGHGNGKDKGDKKEGSSSNDSSAAARRLVQLLQDRNDLAVAKLRRQNEFYFKQGLSYHLTVCVKQ